jgi:tetratricopeptide (TPR) repeat protein
VLAQEAHGALSTEVALPLGLRSAHAVVSYVWYLGKLAWPEGLAILYPHPYLAGGIPWAAWQVIGSLLLLLAISGWVFLGRRRPYAVVGWCWYLGMLVPVIGLVQAGLQGMADRYSYLPSIGLFILLVWGGAELASRLRSMWQRRAAQGAAALAVAALAAAAWVQAGYWHDSVSLYRRSLAASDGRSQVYVNLGASLREKGRAAEAIAVYQQGLDRYPDDGLIHMNFGNALRDQNRTADAIEHYRMALRSRPEDPLVHGNLALALASRGELAAAEAAAREAVRLGPQLAITHELLEKVLLAQGRSGEPQPSGDAEP